MYLVRNVVKNYASARLSRCQSPCVRAFDRACVREFVLAWMQQKQILLKNLREEAI